jgi:hypothetical protein
VNECLHDSNDMQRAGGNRQKAFESMLRLGSSKHAGRAKFGPWPHGVFPLTAEEFGPPQHPRWTRDAAPAYFEFYEVVFNDLRILLRSASTKTRSSSSMMSTDELIPGPVTRTT